MMLVGVKSERDPSLGEEDDIADIARRILVKCENANSGGLQLGLLGCKDSGPTFQHTVSVTGCAVTFRIEVSGLMYSADEEIERNTTITKGEALYWLGLLGYKREHLTDIDTERKELFESNMSNCAVGSVCSQTGLTDQMVDTADINQEVHDLPYIEIKQEPLSDDEIQNNCENNTTQTYLHNSNPTSESNDGKSRRLIAQKHMHSNELNVAYDNTFPKKIKLEKDVSSEVDENMQECVDQCHSPAVHQGGVECNVRDDVETMEIAPSDENVLLHGQPGDGHKEFPVSTKSGGSSAAEHIYTCRMCDFSCNQSDSLREHMTQHIASDLYKCTICDYSCRKFSHITQHMTVHAQKKSYRCVYCDFETKKCTRLHSHMCTHVEPRRYTCSKCNFTCKKCVVLKEHYMNEHKNTNTHITYQCTICEQGFQNVTDFQHHMEQHIPSKLYKCCKCDFECKKCTSLKEHIIMELHSTEDCENVRDAIIQETTGVLDQHDDEPSLSHRETTRTDSRYRCHKCTICGYIFKQAYNVRRHMLVHTEQKPFSCEFCTYTCSRADTLAIHLRRHSGKKPFLCNLCSYKSVKSSNLNRHLKTHREGVKRLRCKTCSYSTLSKSDLTLHNKKHDGNGKLTCGNCDYTTKNTSHFKIHSRIHSQDRPYKCNTCGYSSTKSNDLTRHIRTHTKDKPFNCTHPTCSFRCSHRGNLMVHERRHTGVRPYKCTMCPYRAAKSWTLVDHIRTHTKQRPYSCKFCMYKSAQSSTMHIHIKRKHGSKTAQ